MQLCIFACAAALLYTPGLTTMDTAMMALFVIAVSVIIVHQIYRIFITIRDYLRARSQARRVHAAQC